MAHEITATDGLVLNKSKAWHGLGTIVKEAPTPQDALSLAAMDWTVEQWQLNATGFVGDQLAKVGLESHVANVRINADGSVGDCLGIVGDGWTPFQNAELAQFACDIVDNGERLRVETAGSIRGGKKVWFLLRGDSFEVKGTKGDAIEPFILLSNGFDGKTALRVTPTTVRVVCSNTLHQVIPRNEIGYEAMSSAAYVARHSGDLDSKVESAKTALAAFLEGTNATHDAMNFLASRDVSNDDVKAFFLEAYQRDFGLIPKTTKTKTDENARKRAQDAFLSVAKRFDVERPIAGANYWNAFNAYSGYVQHERDNRGDDDAKKAENALHSNIFGSNASRTSKAFDRALQLAS